MADTPEVMVESRAAAAAIAERPTSRTAALVIILVWVASIALVVWLMYRHMTSGA